jgi:hypothetical protein
MKKERMVLLIRRRKSKTEQKECAWKEKKESRVQTVAMRLQRPRKFLNLKQLLKCQSSRKKNKKTPRMFSTGIQVAKTVMSSLRQMFPSLVNDINQAALQSPSRLRWTIKGMGVTIFAKGILNPASN